MSSSNSLCKDISKNILSPPPPPPPPTPYMREVWHYKHAKIELIKRSVIKFDWNRAFANQNINEQVETLNCTLLNIFRNFIPQLNVGPKIHLG